MQTKAVLFGLAALLSTGLGLAAQAPKVPATKATKMVVYKSPT